MDVALTIAAFISTQAAGPFQVRRATRGQDVQSSPPLATIVTSRFDGDLASMLDGTSYYYGVCDAVASMDTADAMRAAVSPDWGGIVDEYARAVERALQAYHHC